jgi:hypothetical protein
MKEIIENLMGLSDDALDKKAKIMMRKWGENPTPLQVLEVLDACAQGSLTSDLGMRVFQVLYDMALKKL